MAAFPSVLVVNSVATNAAGENLALDGRRGRRIVHPFVVI